MCLSSTAKRQKVRTGRYKEIQIGWYPVLSSILHCTYACCTYEIPVIDPGSGLTFEALQIARVSDKAYDAFSRISSRAIDFISCIIFKTLLGNDVLYYNTYLYV